MGILGFTDSPIFWLQTFPVKQTAHLATCGTVCGEYICTWPQAIIVRKIKASECTQDRPDGGFDAS